MALSIVKYKKKVNKHGSVTIHGTFVAGSMNKRKIFFAKGSLISVPLRESVERH